MDTKKFEEILSYNEPTFGYKGKDYTICSPNGKFYVWAEDSPNDENLEFNDYEDLINNWIIQGKPLKSILDEIELTVIE